MSRNDGTSFLDGIAMRVVAGVVIVACIGALFYLNRGSVVEQPDAEAAGLNPEFIKCRDTRVGHVEKMLADGVISQDKLEGFKKRALDACAGQFPPEG